MMRVRMLVAIVLVAATGLFARAAQFASSVPRPALAALPLTIDAWAGQDAGALDPESQRILAADAYLNRSYAASATPPVGLYIAYYAQQRPGVSIHSPLHCLPGTGWEPLDVATVALPGGAAARRMIVRKDLDRAVVLYWYAVHGRILASEAASKLWLLHDSLRMHRSDAALVRIVVPVGRDADSPQTAEQQGLAFARDLLPFLSKVWS